MTYDVSFADLQVQPLAAIDLAVPSPEQIADLIGPAFEEAAGVASRQGVALTGPPVAGYLPAPDGWRVTVGFPVAGAVRAEGRVHHADLPGGRFALVTHTGPYEDLVDAYAAVRDYALENGFACEDGWWERYLDTPDVPAPRTEVLVPCHRVRPRAAAPSAAAPHRDR
jgi:effector-binding domain-containing protein